MDRELAERLLGEMARLRQSLEARARSDAGPGVGVDEGKWLSSILGHSPDVISIMDPSGRLHYLSRAVPERNTIEFLGADTSSFLVPADRPRWQDAIKRALDTGEVQQLEVQSNNKQWWRTRLISIKRADGAVWVLAIGTDVTAQRQAERALADARQERDLALEASGMGQWRWNVERDEVLLDEVSKRIFGWPADARGLTYATFLEAIHPDDREMVGLHTDRVLVTGRFLDLGCRIVQPEGKVRFILLKGKVRIGAHGRPCELFGGLLDVTESKELETSQRRIQKLEAIGQLAGGVAHDFNNLLVAIVGNVEMAKRASADEREEMLDEALQACTRATHLTQQLLAFARRQTVPDTAVNLNELLGDTVRLLRRLIPENIEIDLVGLPPLPLILADRGQIEQVVMNLCVNARDAMPTGGKLSLQTETVAINGKFRESHPWARPGRYVLLTVTDSGCGIAQNHLDLVFDPFFTTKENGSGLGLATVYGIVKRHGGLIHVSSERGKGTTFNVYLPVSEREAADHGVKPDEAVRGGPETILIAEDEPHVRAVVVRILSGAGYAIIEARDGQEALELFKAERSRVDLVLMDAVMPRMGGPEALAEIRLLAPQLPVIISSGYTETSGGPIVHLAAAFLPKPYEPDALLRIVRRTLDEARVRHPSR